MRKKGLLMEVLKVNNGAAKTSPSAAGFFYRRIGGTLFKVRVYTGSGYADTLDEKISRLIYCYFLRKSLNSFNSFFLSSDRLLNSIP